MTDFERIGAAVYGFLTQQKAFPHGPDAEILEHIQQNQQLSDAFIEGVESGLEHNILFPEANEKP